MSGIVSLPAKWGSRAARVAVAAMSALLRAGGAACGATVGVGLAEGDVVVSVCTFPATGTAVATVEGVIGLGAKGAIASRTTVSADGGCARAGRAVRQSEAVQKRRNAVRWGTAVLPVQVWASVVTLGSRNQKLDDHPPDEARRGLNKVKFL